MWPYMIYDDSGLFYFLDDPYEHDNLYSKERSIFKEMKAKLDMYKKSIVPPFSNKPDPAGNPKNFNGYWTPGWC